MNTLTIRIAQGVDIDDLTYPTVFWSKLNSQSLMLIDSMKKIRIYALEFDGEIQPDGGNITMPRIEFGLRKNYDTGTALTSLTGPTSSTDQGVLDILFCVTNGNGESSHLSYQALLTQGLFDLNAGDRIFWGVVITSTETGAITLNGYLTIRYEVIQ